LVFQKYEDADKMDKLMDRQALLQDKIDALGAWEIDTKLEIAMDAVLLMQILNKELVWRGTSSRGFVPPLLQQPDVLLLDEPTNHLDAESGG
jgi:ATPase subunit of ABC transporter with duplicated ATPase domains